METPPWKEPNVNNGIMSRVPDVRHMRLGDGDAKD